MLFLSCAALAAASCAYWLVCALLAVRTWTAVPTVAALPVAPVPSAWPLVSIVVPARNEGAHVGAALAAKLSDGYPALEILLVDDRSTDDTGARASALGDPRVRVVRIDALPEGWLGKVHALQRGLEAARGEWVLFSDADVHLAPGTLTRVVVWAEAEKVDHVAALPRIRPSGPVLALALATFMRLIATFARLRSVTNPASTAAVGVGAFNLFRREALARSPGLEWLKMEVADDMALGVMLKRAGARQRVVIAGDAVSLEFYPSYRAMVRALEKNGATAPPAATLAGLLALVLLELGFAATLLVPSHALAILGGLSFGVAVVTQLGVSRWLATPSWPAFFPGLGSLLLAVALARSAVLAWWRGGIVWRGTFYPTSAVRAGARLTARVAPDHRRTGAGPCRRSGSPPSHASD